MRKFKLFFLTTLAVMFFTVSCVENEESESIKNMRMAQAELIEAKANQTNMEARAQATFDSIQAEIDLAQLQIEQAKADYEVAEYENEQALLELELEAAQMEQQRLIAEAEARMKEAEKDLEVAIRELEEEIARSEVSNPALDEYLDKYNDAATEVKNTRSDILDLQRDIARAHQYNQYEGEDSSMIVLMLEQKERELANLEDWKTKYEEVADDPSIISTEINDAEASLENINKQIDEKELEVMEAQKVSNEADEAFNEALSDYNDAVDDSTEIYEFTYEVGGVSYPQSIPYEYLERIVNEPYGYGRFYSIEYYDEQIANTSDPAVQEDYEEEKAVVVAYIDMIHDEYGGNIYTAIDDLTDAYFTAKDAKDEAQDALDDLNEELSQLEDEQTYTEDYITALENDYDALVANLDGIKDDIEGVKNEITEIENNVGSWEDYIDMLEDDLAGLQEELEVHQAQMNEYKQLIDQELSEE